MIELAIAANGDPPVEFARVALGSHGRREPVPSSDVDSGLAWSDPGPGGEAAAEASLKAIAADVTDTVEVLGWKLDAHGVTAPACSPRTRSPTGGGSSPTGFRSRTTSAS